MSYNKQHVGRKAIDDAKAPAKDFSFKKSKLQKFTQPLQVEGWLDQYQPGGSYSPNNNLNTPVYNPSETTNQPIFEEPYKRANIINRGEILTEIERQQQISDKKKKLDDYFKQATVGRNQPLTDADKLDLATQSVDQSRRPLSDKVTDFGIDMALGILPVEAVVMGAIKGLGQTTRQVYKGLKNIPKSLPEKSFKSKIDWDIWNNMFRNTEKEQGVKWLKDWYNHPIIIEKIKNLQKYDDIIGNNIINRYSNHIHPNKRFSPEDVNRIKHPKSDYFFRSNSHWDKLDLDERIIYGDTQVGKMMPKTSTTIHEGTHQLTHNGGFFNKKTEDLLQQGFKDTPDEVLPPWVGKIDKTYYTSPTEIHARINEIRNALNLTPSDKVTIKMLDGIFKTPAGKEMKPYIKNKSLFLETLNEFPSLILPIGLGTGVVMQQKKDGGSSTTKQQGYKIDKRGYHNSDNLGAPVIVPSNRITMKGPNGELGYFKNPILGVGADGQEILMQPDQEYVFNKGPVTEYEMDYEDARFGGRLRRLKRGRTTSNVYTGINKLMLLNPLFDNQRLQRFIPRKQVGGTLDMYGNPIIAEPYINEYESRSNYDPRTNTMNLGWDYSDMDDFNRNKLIAHENRHAWQFLNDRTNFDVTHNPENLYSRMLNKPPMMTTDEVYYGYHDRKEKEIDIEIERLREENPDFKFIPRQMMYDKIVDQRLYNIPFSKEGEADYYQETGRDSLTDYSEEYQLGGNTGWLDNYQDIGEASITIDNTKVTNFEDPYKRAANLERQNYYNPEFKKGLTTGDWRQDLLYENQWTYNLPIVSDIIKKYAKNVASQSGNPHRSIERLKEINDLNIEKEKYIGSFTGAHKKKGAPTLLNQYFSDTDLYPRSIYKPTDDYLKFLPSYSIKGDVGSSEEIDDMDNRIREEIINDNISKHIDDILFLNKGKTNHLYENLKKTTNLYDDFIKNKKSIYSSQNDSPLTSITDSDLSSHKTGMAWDNEINLPYVSISDAWDFSPEHFSKKWGIDGDGMGIKDIEESYIQSSLMHKAGTPFKIYDRYYFDPKTRKYISDNKISKLKKQQYGGIITTSGYVPAGVYPQFQNPDGTHSNEVSKEMGIGDLEYLLPSFWDGQRHNDDQTYERFKKTGEHLGVFPNKESITRGAQLREFMNNEVLPYKQVGGPTKSRHTQIQEYLNAYHKRGISAIIDPTQTDPREVTIPIDISNVDTRVPMDSIPSRPVGINPNVNQDFTIPPSEQLKDLYQKPFVAPIRKIVQDITPSIRETPINREVDEDVVTVPKTLKKEVDKRQIPHSGMIIDKGKNIAYVIGPHGTTYSFPILTGANSKGNEATPWFPTSFKEKVTSRGYYLLEPERTPNTQDHLDYNNKFRQLTPIPAFGMPAAYDHTKFDAQLGFHQTFGQYSNPIEHERRKTLYTCPEGMRWTTAGCVNARPFEYDLVNKLFPKADTVMIIDSRIPEDALKLEEVIKIFNKPKQIAKKPTIVVKKPNLLASKQFGGDIDDYQEGGDVSKLKVYQQWEYLTGTPWSEAKRQGLTDGSYEQNIALITNLRQQGKSSMLNIVHPTYSEPKPFTDDPYLNQPIYNPSENVQSQSPTFQDPREIAKINAYAELAPQRELDKEVQRVIAQNTLDKKLGVYKGLVPDATITAEQNIQRRLKQKDLENKTAMMMAGIPIAAMAPELLGYLGSAMSAAPAIAPWLSANTALNTAMVAHGVSSIPKTKEAWQKAYDSGSVYDAIDAAGTTALTAFELSPATNLGKVLGEINTTTKTIATINRDKKYTNAITFGKKGENQQTVNNSVDFMKAYQEEVATTGIKRSLNKKEIKFLNQEIKDRGILEIARKSPLDPRPNLVKRGFLPEDYNLKKAVTDFIPNLIKGDVRSQYTMGKGRENAFNQWLGLPTKNSIYRVHPESFTGDNGLVYTVPHSELKKLKSQFPEYELPSKDTFNELKLAKESLTSNTKEFHKRAYDNLLERGYPKEILGNKKDFKYDINNPDYGFDAAGGTSHIKDGTAYINDWDKYIGAHGNTYWKNKAIKNSKNEIWKMVDEWDINPFSRMSNAPKWIQNIDVSKLVGAKNFTVNLDYITTPKGLVKPIYNERNIENTLKPEYIFEEALKEFPKTSPWYIRDSRLTGNTSRSHLNKEYGGSINWLENYK